MGPHFCISQHSLLVAAKQFLIFNSLLTYQKQAVVIIIKLSDKVYGYLTL